MAVIAEWNGIKFQMNESETLLITGLKLSAECEVEEKMEDGQKFVSAKNGKPVQATITAILNSSLGVDVRQRVTELTNAAQRGASNYFYIGGKKLVPPKLMLVSAATEEVNISPSGRWSDTKMNLTFKQSTKDWIVGAPPPPPVAAGNSSGYTEPAKKSVKNQSPSSPATAPKSGTKPNLPKKSNITFAIDLDSQKTFTAKVNSVVSQAKSVPSTVKKTSSSTIKNNKLSLTKANKKL